MDSSRQFRQLSLADASSALAGVCGNEWQLVGALKD